MVARVEPEVGTNKFHFAGTSISSLKKNHKSESDIGKAEETTHLVFLISLNHQMIDVVASFLVTEMRYLKIVAIFLLTFVKEGSVELSPTPSCNESNLVCGWLNDSPRGNLLVAGALESELI